MSAETCIQLVTFYHSLRAVAALAPIGTLLVALWAARTWWRTLSNQRADECISAVHEMIAAIDRCLTLKEKSFWNKGFENDLWPAFFAAWSEIWPKLDMSIAAAHRYHHNLEANISEQFKDILFATEDLIKDDWKEFKTGNISEKALNRRRAITEQSKVIAERVRRSV